MLLCAGRPGQNPPPDIDAGLRAILAAEDPGRTYQPSSMDGGNLGGNESEHNPRYGLAPKDGPYGFELPSTCVVAAFALVALSVVLECCCARVRNST